MLRIERRFAELEAAVLPLDDTRMDWRVGIEPTDRGFADRRVSQLARARLVLRDGVEPPSPDSQSGTLPLSYRSVIWFWDRDSNPNQRSQSARSCR